MHRSRLFYSTVASLLVCILSGCGEGREKPAAVPTGALYEYSDISPRWASPENEKGEKGQGGRANNGGKGHASTPIPAGATLNLLDVRGQGVIDRIWITISDRSPSMLRSLKLEMIWDDASKPAVSVPIGDFFGVGLGRMAAFHNAFFADPEGRSFNCYIPMPFRSGARIRVINESGRALGNMFYDVDYHLTKGWREDNLYFHACWKRDTATTMASDLEVLPAVQGRGRFLGMNVGVNSNPIYGDLWWGEGEVKMYLDGDKDNPTLNGTGTEDYIGTAWGQGKFFTDYTGCTVGDGPTGQWAWYRYHVPDPIFFKSDCRVVLQQMGGGPSAKVAELQKRGVPLIPAAIYDSAGGHFVYRKGGPVEKMDGYGKDGWTNFFRTDDVSATAYFYLSTPANELPALQSIAIRTYNLKEK